jgi:hypothetical protein
MKNVKDMVKDGKKVYFQFFRKDTLYYRTECGFEFRVPSSDTGDGVFLNEDRAMMFMRYINKELKEAQAQELEAEREIKAVNQ